MTLPNRNQQIDAVAKFLDSDRNEGRSLKEIATEIVDGYHELLLAGLKTPDVVIRDGMLIKSAVSAKVHRVLLIGDDLMWVIAETTGYGWLGPIHTQFWDGAEEFRPKRRVEVGGKKVLMEMTDEEIAEAWSNPKWNMGDLVSQRQRQHVYEVIAVGPQCVLLKDSKGKLCADSNSNLEKFYKKELRGVADW